MVMVPVHGECFITVKNGYYMKVSIMGISTFLVSYLYKWLFPAVTTIAFLFFADQEKNLFVRFILWFLLCTAYLSIPINFEKPKKEMFHFFLEKKPLVIIIAIAQSFVLGLGVYGLTILSISLYFSPPAKAGQLISVINGLLYFLTMQIEYSLLKRRTIK